MIKVEISKTSNPDSVGVNIYFKPLGFLCFFFLNFLFNLFNIMINIFPRIFIVILETGVWALNGLFVFLIFSVAALGQTELGIRVIPRNCLTVHSHVFFYTVSRPNHPLYCNLNFRFNPGAAICIQIVANFSKNDLKKTINFEMGNNFELDSETIKTAHPAKFIIVISVVTKILTGS